MNRLYLVRHGIAVPHGSLEYAEDDRPLTPKGETRIRQVARGLRRLGVKVDHIVTSPLPRAARTAELVAESLGIADALETADALRSGQTGDALHDWLSGRAEPRLMIVGHNPGFSELAGILTSGDTPLPAIELRKGGVAAFVKAGGPGRWRLDWLARPRLLRCL